MRLLAGPASLGARDLVLAQLARARRRAGPARREPRGEALHDFRVALRRLRTLLKDYRKPLALFGGLAAPREGLRRAARLTNKARDAEVWARTLRGLAAGREVGAGVSSALERLGASGRAEAARGFARFGSAAAALSRLLARAPRSAVEGTLGETAARLVGKAARRLERRLDQVRKGRDGERLHRARLGAKRLRYLLEPFAARTPGAVAALSRLRSLQRLLGTIHDLEGLEGFLAALPEGRELRRDAAEAREDLTDDLLASWGRRRGRAVIAAYESLAERLARPGAK